MGKVVGISFDEKGTTYFFDPGNLVIPLNVTVIVKTERGLQFGKAVTKIEQQDESKLKEPLKPVIRISTKDDYHKHLKNLADREEIVKECTKLIKKYSLDMRIIDVSLTFDRNQLMIRYVSDNRIDFRQLVKDLAAKYKTRIELRQIGIRDKAKEIGGYGCCGQKLCCSRYLNDFDSVSINMAKNQNIALNPNKINGLCGRLMCCLKYEDDTYCKLKKCAHCVGEKIKTPKGDGKVISVNLLKQKSKVITKDNEIIEMDFNKDDCRK